MTKKTRNIPISEYFENLQLEYLLYELRSKIYPTRRYKDRFVEVMGFKRDKIDNISQKNDLLNMFTSTQIDSEIQEKFYDEFGVPVGMTNRDKYFYYFIGADFSYNGKIVQLIHYNLDENIATISVNGEEKEVDLPFLRRVL